MADVFPSLQPTGADALAQMLAAIQRQGAAQSAQTGPMIYDSLTQALGSIAGNIQRRRGREFEAGQAQKEREFRTDLAGTEFQNRLSAGREEDRLARLRDEDARAFATTTAATSEANLVKRQQAERLFEAGQRGAAQGAASQQAGLDRYFQSQRDIAARKEREGARRGAKELGYAQLVNERRDKAASQQAGSNRMKAQRLQFLEARRDEWGAKLMDAFTPETQAFAKARFDDMDEQIAAVGGRRMIAPAPAAAQPSPDDPSALFAEVKKSEPRTYGELVKKQKAMREGPPGLAALAADIEAKIARPAAGLNVRDTAAQTALEAASRKATARSIAEMFTEEGEGVFDLSGRVKTAKGRVFNNAIRLMAGSWPNTPATDDEETIIRILGSQFPSPFGGGPPTKPGLAFSRDIPHKAIVTEQELRDFIRYAKTLFPK